MTIKRSLAKKPPAGHRARAGAVLAALILLVATLNVAVWVMLDTAPARMDAALRHVQTTRAFYAAESAAGVGVRLAIQTQAPVPPTTLGLSTAWATVSSVGSVSPGDPFRIVAHSRSGDASRSVRVDMDFR